MVVNHQRHRFTAANGVVKAWLKTSIISATAQLSQLASWGLTRSRPKLVLVPARLILKPPRD